MNEKASAEHGDGLQTGIQTIGPLLLQLHQRGFGAEELERVDRVYHFAMRLWAVNFQSSSRPFLCHLVGTASQVARHGGDLEMVLAALLHAAYGTGDFGVRIGGVTPRKRKAIRRVAGPRAEELIHCFYEFLIRYGPRWERVLHERAEEGFTETEQTVLFLRVCNDLDDAQDLPFCSSARRERIGSFTRGSIELAQFLGRPDLAAQLEELTHLEERLFLPDSIVERYKSGHVVVPPAFTKRLVPGMLEVLHRWWTTGSPRVRH